MQTCETCQHWRGPGSQEAAYWGTGDEGVCNTDLHGLRAFGDCADAAVVTTSQFGCTLHEPKDKTDIKSD